MRDNSLVRELRAMGHDAIMVPMYLPPVLEGADMSRGRPVFFGGINVVLQQALPLFARLPRWLDAPLSWRWVLRGLGRLGNMTRPASLGGMTVSMLRGAEGRQSKELERLTGWLAGHFRPEVVCLSNSLLLGVARRLREELGAAMVCTLQGEDGFVDGLGEAGAKDVWRLIGQRAGDVDCFVAVSQYCAGVMRRRAGLPESKISVVRNGISLEGYDRVRPPVEGASIGYLARMCPEKGLDVLVDAFIEMKRTERIPGLRLRVAGALAGRDAGFVARLKRRLAAKGLAGVTEFIPNPTREEKQSFLRSLMVFSVPTVYGEAFGMYVLEALATGVPVVQPRHGAFPELIEATGGGLLVEPDNPRALAQGIEELLINPRKGRVMGQRGREVVLREFSSRRMAEQMIEVFHRAVEARKG